MRKLPYIDDEIIANEFGSSANVNHILEEVHKIPASNFERIQILHRCIYCLNLEEELETGKEVDYTR